MASEATVGEAGSDMRSVERGSYSVVGAGVDTVKGCVNTIKGLYVPSDLENNKEAGE
jgi:hypothetical protein